MTDLLNLLSPEKKQKMYGWSNYLLNLVQISKNLQNFLLYSAEKGISIPEETQKKKWWEPKYIFKSEEKYQTYLSTVLFDYGISPKDSVVIFVEGPTESTLLKNWLKFVHYRTGIPVSVKILGGKSKDFVFTDYFFQNFHQDSYLVIDSDSKSYIRGKLANLENIGIPRERIYIPNPDFVTENFKPIELIEALKIFIEENYEEEESCRFQNQFYSTILAKLDAQ